MIFYGCNKSLIFILSQESIITVLSAVTTERKGFIMNYFNQDKETVVSQLGSDKQNGLTDEQVLKSREKYGENVISEEKQKSLLMIFLEQFADLLVVILIIASIVSMISAEVGSTIVILFVLVMNAVIGTVQNVKAQKSLNSLKAMSSPNARVIRNGIQVEIPATEVVVGDILLIEAGNVAAADGRLLEAASLQVNESALTGESLNVVKSTDAIASEELALGDRVNMLYSGSNISNGRGVAVVTGVGMDTEIGKIASLMQNAKKKKTPLQVSLDKFSMGMAVTQNAGNTDAQGHNEGHRDGTGGDTAGIKGQGQQRLIAVDHQHQRQGKHQHIKQHQNIGKLPAKDNS